MSKVLIIGTGAFGTALANVLLENNHTVNMYGINDDQMNDLEKGYNKEFFGNSKMCKKPTLVTTDFSKAVKGVEYLVIALPSKYIEDTLIAHHKLIKKDVVIINSSKGIDPITGTNYFELIRRILPKNKICAIAGPSFAKELFNKQHTIVNIICRDKKVGQKTADLFKRPYFKLTVCDDEIGASLFSALKNGLAVGSGILYAKGYSINTISAFITRGIQEITNFVVSEGGKIDTVTDYCAIGDIYLTCSSNKSRNFKLGQEIAKKGIKKALDENKLTVEGLKIIKDIHDKMGNNPDFSLFNLLYKLVSCKISPDTLIQNLWKLL